MGLIYSQAVAVLAAHGFMLNLERDGKRESSPHLNTSPQPSIPPSWSGG